MKILFSPQVPLNFTDKIIYKFDGDIIEVELPDGTHDVFDFAGLPDGVLDIESIESDLSLGVFLSAKKEDGVLYVELLNYIGTDATESERFPDWIDHEDYVAPIVEPIEEEGEDDGKDTMEE